MISVPCTPDSGSGGCPVCQQVEQLAVEEVYKGHIRTYVCIRKYAYVHMQSNIVISTYVHMKL